MKSWKMIPRPKVPSMPWTHHAQADAVTRDFFDRLREQKGSTAALRLWKDFNNWMEAVGEMPSDDDVRDLDPENNPNDLDMLILKQEGEARLKAFADRLNLRSPGEADEFWLVWKSWRVVHAGTQRSQVAKAGER